MVLFFAKGKVDSDKFVKFCYGHYRDIMAQYGADLPKEVEIIRSDGEKPRFDTDEAYFNLSHTDGVVMLGISHAPIGVDIEKIRDIDFKKFDFIDAANIEEFFENGRKERVISNLPVKVYLLSGVRFQRTLISSIFPCGRTTTLAYAPTNRISSHTKLTFPPSTTADTITMLILKNKIIEL